MYSSKVICSSFVLCLQSIWQSSRWLFLLMFGLPTAVVSIVCYSICCKEGADDVPEEDSDLEEEGEEETGQGQE